MLKRVLVTGGGGFIGRAATLSLRARGFEVHAAGRRTTADLPADIRWYQADLLEEGAVAGLLQRIEPSHVVHAAWEVTPGKYRASPANLDWLRVSLGLIDYARLRPETRLIGIGTCFEYDLTAGTLSEMATPCRPQTVYGRCKLSLALAFETAAALGLSTAWGRVFYPYGPGEADGRLLPAVARACLSGQPLDCTVATQRRDFVYIEDLGEQIALLADGAVTGNVNLCGGAPITLHTLIDGLARRLGGAGLMRYGARAAAGEDALPLIAGDIARLRGEVGWNPALTLDETLDRTAAWWRLRG